MTEQNNTTKLAGQDAGDAASLASDVEIELAEYWEHMCSTGKTGVPAMVFTRLLVRLRADAARLAASGEAR